VVWLVGSVVDWRARWFGWWARWFGRWARWLIGGLGGLVGGLGGLIGGLGGLIGFLANGAGQTAAKVSKYRPPMPIMTLVIPRLRSDGMRWHLEGRSAARQCLIHSGLLPVLAAPSPSGMGLAFPYTTYAWHVCPVTGDVESICGDVAACACVVC
jgi:hypothetical protein